MSYSANRPTEVPALPVHFQSEHLCSQDALQMMTAAEGVVMIGERPANGGVTYEGGMRCWWLLTLLCSGPLKEPLMHPFSLKRDAHKGIQCLCGVLRTPKALPKVHAIP